jgi:hypothetical protein
MPNIPGPVTADDLDDVVLSAVVALDSRTDRNWRTPAAGLDWDCWETVEHVADDLFAYAAQISPRRPPLTGYAPIDCRRPRPGAPLSTIFGDPEAGPAGLVQVLDSCGGLLSAVVRTAAPTVRAYHAYGISDPAGFAAMGIVETLVHLQDLAPVLEFDWVPAEDVCDRVRYRLFPAAPTDTEPWPTLLWATGRGELPGRPHLEKWRWSSEPR